MSLLANINFLTTVLTFGCVSFAASNFGIKLGKLASFSNTSGYKYISDAGSEKSNKLYEDIVKVYKNDTKAPPWVKSKEELKKWCEKHQKSLRYWDQTSKYCLIRNNVRHQLIDKGYTLKEEVTIDNAQNIKCSEILNWYSDDSENSMGYLLGRSKCVNPKPAAAAA